MATVLEPETADQIVIEDNKAVERLVIPVPKGGGLVVLRGDNGSGKTEALNAVRAALGNKEAKSALRPTDGEKTGTVEAFGVTITIGRSNREKGELTVSSLEDVLDIADLVDPGIDDLNAADSRRLKSLLKVAGAKGDIDLFSKLLGDTFELDADIIKERDLVKQAGGIKRSLESKARSEESAADTATLEATACLKATEGIDLTAECDEARLQAEYRAAVQLDTQIDDRLKAAEESADAQKSAQESIARSKASYTGPNVETAQVDLGDAQRLEAEQHDLVRKLEADLITARSELKLRQEQTKSKQSALDSAVSHANTITEWQKQLDREIPQAPSADEIEAASQRLKVATTALELGAVIRKAKESQAKADEFTEKAKAHRKLAEQWREAAKSVDEVLSEQVAGLGCPISVDEDDKGLRLMVQHKRGVIPFAELSAGEKWATVIPIAIKAVGEDGVFVIPQTAYEGLQPRVRKQIVSQLKGSHVTAITAECADGDIKAEVAV